LVGDASGNGEKGAADVPNVLVERVELDQVQLHSSELGGDRWKLMQNNPASSRPNSSLPSTKL
jgi:hypothetical protein